MDTRWDVSFRIQGNDFHPSRVPFAFDKQHDPGVIGTLGRYKGKPVPYGSADYTVPFSVPVKNRIKHLVEVIEPILPALRESGADDWFVSIGRYFHAQCNEEYSLENLQLIARLECGFTYSAYEITEEEEKKRSGR